MRDRAFLVSELICNPFPDPQLIEELGNYGHACDRALAHVTKSHIFSVLRLLGEGTLNAAQVTAWASRLEGREDLAFEFGEEGVVREVVFWLANPEINWPVDSSLCRRIETIFERRSNPRYPAP